MMEVPLAEVSTEGVPEAAALKTQGKRVSLGYRRPVWTVKGFGGKIRQIKASQGDRRGEASEQSWGGGHT